MHDILEHPCVRWDVIAAKTGVSQRVSITTQWQNGLKALNFPNHGFNERQTPSIRKRDVTIVAEDAIKFVMRLLLNMWVIDHQKNRPP